MEIHSIPRFIQNPIPHPTSPNSSSSSSSSSSSNGSAPVMTPSNPLPKPITKSIDANSYPTTFIQADTTSFKQVVQMLTGSSETAAKHAQTKAMAPKKPSFKLYERRNSFRNLKSIKPLIPTSPNSTPCSPMGGRRQPELLSPSVLDFPSLALSPVTPLIADPFDRSAEEKAIAQKGFYLHPSPRGAAAAAAKDAEPPRLLPLFPVTSPRGHST